MAWYRFDWSVFATRLLLDRLLGGAGVAEPTPEQRDLIRANVANILAASGSLNVSRRSIPAARRYEIGEQLFARALGCALASSRQKRIPGVRIDGSRTSGPQTVTAIERVAINFAPTDLIETLPAVGRRLAKRIVTAREERPFRGLNDFRQRIGGVGSALVHQLATLITFELPRARMSNSATGDLWSDWPACVAAQVGATPMDRISRALVSVLGAVQTMPTPSPPLLQEPRPPEPGVNHEASEVIALLEGAYYARLPSMFAGASKRIDVCMFHIAMPSKGHPTRRLLDALIAAKDRGVRVRVLVDSDRPEDPYRSTIINAAAIECLSDGGVAVRSDIPERLLHSKFVLIDNEWAVIGSHNWSAGSYFQFDDLTLAIRSVTAVREQRGRFDVMWAAAETRS
jgi:hypothetical protein